VKNPVGSAERGMTFDQNAAPDPTVTADSHMFADDGIGTDRNIRTDIGPGMHDCGVVNLRQHRTSISGL
jgi:hypothetical protein